MTDSAQRAVDGAPGDQRVPIRSTGRRLAIAMLALTAVASTTAGCGFHGLYSASLPGSVGGPFSSAKTYTVTVYFDDVLDLVPQSAVKVNDVTVGSVSSIGLVNDGGSYRAKVVCKVESSVRLPANATAILEETSLLGEKYVELVNPEPGSKQVDPSKSSAPGSLQAEPAAQRSIGQYPDTAATSAYPGVEEVFGVLSTVLNGGGLEKLQTINSELSAALAGRESQVHDVVGQLNTFVSGLNGVKTQINGAIDALDTLSKNLNAQDATIATALDDIGPGLKVLADQRANLVSLLQGLSSLGVVSNRVIGASLSATKADLSLLEPILTQLNAAGKNLPGALELAFDYPFPSTATQAIKGDQTNLVINVDTAGTLKALCGTAPTSTNAALTQACNTLVGTLTSVTKVLGGVGGLSRSMNVRPGGNTLSDILGAGATG